MNFSLDEGSCSCTATEELPHGRVIYCKARVARLELSGKVPFHSVVGDPESSVALDLGLHPEPSCLTRLYTMMEVCR